MPDTNDRVMAMIERELAANPQTSNEELRAKAEKLDEAVARMSARQFNATYPLQVKRKLQPRRPRGARKAKRAGRKARGAAKRGRRAGAGGKRGRPPKSGASGANGTRAGVGARAVGRGEALVRDRVRSVLVGFASDLAAADGAGLVKVIAGVDGYVDRVMKATGVR
jgi:hypothetical protein